MMEDGILTESNQLYNSLNQYQPSVSILIAEDNSINRALLSKKLKVEGFNNLYMAINGQEAYELAVKHNPDLILMDVQMPVMDGNEAMRKLRENNFQGKIVALSANDFKEEIEKSLKSGANEYITKPINFTRFFEIIRQLVFGNNKRQQMNVSAAVIVEKTVTARLPHDKENAVADCAKPIIQNVSKSVKQIFLDDAYDKLIIINNALKDFEQDKLRIKAIAHEYKGNARYFGLQSLEDLARNLDLAFKADENDEKLKTMTDELVFHIREIIRCNS
jgi:CheY-like chemotaxis protein